MLEELQRILRLESRTERIRLVPPMNSLEGTDVPYLGRSLLGVFYLLSQAVASNITVKEEEGYVVTHGGLLLAAIFSLLTLELLHQRFIDN